ncbi:MAG: hypothetical protein ACI86M_001180 [Saprospiraceae bacterium]|jgi:hypothetical protein
MEYQELLASLFNNSDNHQEVVEALAKHTEGLYRNDLLYKFNLKGGGGITTIFEKLESSGFIARTIPYGNAKKDLLFKIKDQYMVFYLRCIKDSKPQQRSMWSRIAGTPSYQSWSGLTFENICRGHIERIKLALNLSAIITNAGAWQSRGDQVMTGAQVDLLIDRDDNVINLCEIKFSTTPFTITNDYANKLRLKVASFNHHTKNRKAIFLTLITTFGLTENIHSKELIQNVITLKDLFKKIRK